MAPLAVNGTVTQFVVSPSSKSMVIGQVFEVHAVAYYPGGSWADVCGSTTWSSLNPAIATVNPAGIITAHSNGTVQIKAVYQYQSSTSGNWQTRTAFCVVTVGSPANMTSLVVSPSTATKPVGLQQQFTARAYYSNGTSLDATAGATWTSTAGATVNASGLATATAVGTSTIQATFNGHSGSAPLTVTAAELVRIEVSPSHPASLPLGFSDQFQAIGIFTDNSQQDVTSQVTWSSSAPGVVQMNPDGTAVTKSVGSATITATAANGVSGSTLSPLEVTPAKLTSITLSPQDASVGVTQQQAFTATGNFSDGTTQDLTSTVTWTSSDETIATVGLGPDGGVAQTLKAGTVTITALDPDPSNPVSASTSLTVTPATVVSLSAGPAGASLVEGDTLQYRVLARMSDGSTEDLTADPSITWTSSFPNLISISNDPGTQGLATALLAGEGTINAIHVDGQTSSVAVTITPRVTLQTLTIAPATRTMRVGETLQYTATGTFTDGTVVDLTESPDILFTSSFPNAGYTSVSNAPGTKGLVTALAPGDDTINAIYKNYEKTSSTALTVLPPVTVKHIILTPASRTIRVGESLQFTATAILTDDTVVDYTNHPDVWFSSKYPSAGYTVQSNEPGTKGLVTGVAPGNDEIWARHLPTGRVGGTALTVVPGVTLQSLSTSPAGITLLEGETRQYKVIGNYSDGTTRDLTEDPDITWTSSFPDIASVSNQPGTKGLVTALKAGSGTINATSATASPWPTSSVALTVRAGLSKVTDVASANEQGTYLGGEGWGALSSDGRYAAFSSASSTLVANDTNGVVDTFVRDRLMGTVERVSVSSDEVQGNRASNNHFVSISGDGRYVVFVSQATNLVPGDTNNTQDIFVRDRVAGTTRRANVSSSGVQGNGFGANPAISANGRYVAFSSNASNLAPNKTDTTTAVFVHDLTIGQTILGSVTSTGLQPNGYTVTMSTRTLSADGRYLCFQSDGTNVVPGDTNGVTDIFVRDLVAGVTRRVSVDSSGAQGNGMCQLGGISADGNRVCFQSQSTNLVPGDTNGFRDIFVHDLTTGQTMVASSNAAGTIGNRATENAALSADGRFVVYDSDATNLTTGDSNNNRDIFVKDLSSGAVRMVTVSTTGGPSNGYSSGPAMSDDGAYVSYYSTASNLVAGDTNGTYDVFVSPNALK